MAHVPLGYHFNPSDDVLVSHYLVNKVTGRLLSTDLAIIECDVYGKEELWKKKFEKHPEEDVLYFFTQNKLKTKKGLRNMDRTAGENHTWRTQFDSKIHKVIAGKKRHIASTKFFSYTDTKSRRATKEWVMYEFRLSDEFKKFLIGKKMYLREYVICRIHRKIATSAADSVALGCEFEDFRDIFSHPSSGSTDSSVNFNKPHLQFLPQCSNPFFNQNPQGLGSSDSFVNFKEPHQQFPPQASAPFYNQNPQGSIMFFNGSTSLNHSPVLDQSPSYSNQEIGCRSVVTEDQNSSYSSITENEAPIFPYPVSMYQTHDYSMNFTDSTFCYMNNTITQTPQGSTPFLHGSTGLNHSPVLDPSLLNYDFNNFNSNSTQNNDNPSSLISEVVQSSAPQAPPANVDTTTGHEGGWSSDFHTALNEEEMARMRLIGELDSSAWNELVDLDTAPTPSYSVEDYLPLGEIFTF